MAATKSKPTPKKRKRFVKPRKQPLPSGMWVRGGIYWSRFRSNGRLVRTRLGTDFRVACDLLTELKARALRGQYGIADNGATIDELQCAFLRMADQTLRPSSRLVYRHRIRNVRAKITARCVRDLVP